MTTNTPSHSCYTVRDAGEGKKGFWIEIGSAWTNRDDSLTLKLDALPVNGQIIVRKRRANSEAA